jgi:polyhydroxyalkanoate synthase subunit PhaC
LIECIHKETVTQRIHLDNYVDLHKEILRVNCSTPLWLVRKHLIGGPQKAAVILVHGFAQNRYSWHTSTRSMSAWLAQKGYDVYNLELRGHGRSRNEGQAVNTGFQDYIDDLINVAMVLPKAYWIGHSLGAAVIYGAAAKMRPLQCLGVIGMGGVFHFASNNLAMRLLCSVTRRITTLPIVQHAHIKTKHSSSLLNRIYPLTNNIGYILPVSGWWPDTIEEELIQERMLIGFDWLSVPIWKDMCFMAKHNQFLYEDEWKKTDVPTLVLLGDKDHFLRREDGEPAYQLSPSNHKKLIIFDDYHHSHHWGHLDIVLGKDAPTYVWPTIIEWIESLPHNSSGIAFNSEAKSSAN